jgi:group I intron endonuclease
MADKSGIYKITCTANGKIYIGSAINLRLRRNQHYSALNVNKHCNKYLQRTYNKYGKNDFKYEVLECCNPDILIEREQYYLDTLLFAQEYLRKENNKFRKAGFNLCPVAGKTLLGVRKSKETRKRMSLARKGEKHYNYGKSLTDEHKANMSKSLVGRSTMPIHQRNILSEKRMGEGNPMYGKPAHNRKTTYFLDLNTGVYDFRESAKEAAKVIDVDYRILNNYIKTGKQIKSHIFFY